MPTAEYNPFECVKTNIMGAMNLIDACIERGIERVVALSTDKASNPINLYGATKLASDKLFVAGNAYAETHQTRFSVVRYGNVVGSRGSVIPYFLAQRSTGTITITDARMSRFLITLEQGADFVLRSLEMMLGGEIFVSKIPSVMVTQLARVIAPDCEQQIIGIRPGEKLHEIMISEDDARVSIEFDNHYVIQPTHSFWNPKDFLSDRPGKPCAEGFTYSSATNDWWLTDDEVAQLAKDVQERSGYEALPAANEPRFIVGG